MPLACGHQFQIVTFDDWEILPNQNRHQIVLDFVMSNAFYANYVAIDIGDVLVTRLVSDVCFFRQVVDEGLM